MNITKVERLLRSSSPNNAAELDLIVIGRRLAYLEVLNDKYSRGEADSNNHGTKF